MQNSGKASYEQDPLKKGWEAYSKGSNRLSLKGEFRQAVREASKALYLGLDDHNQMAVAFAARDMATAYHFAGESKLALFWLERSFEAFSKRSFENAEATLLFPNLITRGNALAYLGRHEEAVKILSDLHERMRFYHPQELKNQVKMALSSALSKQGKLEEAYKLVGEVLATPSDNMVMSSVYLAKASLERAWNKPDEARQSLSKLLTLEKLARNDPNPAWAHYELYLIETGSGNTLAALSAIAKAADTASKLRNNFRSSELRVGLQRDFQLIYHAAVTAHAEQGNFAKAVNFSNQARARALLDLIRERETITIDSKKINPTAAAQSTKQIQQALPNNTLILGYHIGEQDSWQMWINKEQVGGKKINLHKESLKQLVEQFRSSITSDNHKQSTDLAEQLGTLLLADLPLAADTHIILVPHGPLHSLPFSALKHKQQWFGTAHPITTTHQFTALTPRPLHQDKDNVSAALFGNPWLGAEDLSLPGAETEVKRIAQLLNTTNLKLGKAASRLAVLESLPKSSLVHIAAHVTLDKLDPMYSAIKLSGEQKVNNLEAHEFYGMDLSHMQQIVLSACNSGMGQVSSGDEFWGFKRSLSASGVNNVVLSLWEIDDESTTLLMQAYYQALLSKQPAAVALQQAIQHLSTSKQFNSPYHWASFQLVQSN
ncbi:MAG: hypothetical protein RLZZ502_1454 [Pseudomonadota bacterium]